MSASNDGASKLGDSFFRKDGRLRPVLRCVVYLTVVIACIIAILAVIISIQKGIYHDQPPQGVRAAMNYIGGVLIFVVIFSCAPLLRRYLDRRSIVSLGFPFGRGWQRLLLIGVIFGAAAQLIVFALEYFTGYARVVSFGTVSGDLREAATAMPSLILSGIAEEMAFRGYLLQNLWEEWGFVPAAIISAALFALAHLGNPHAGANVALTIMGLAGFGLFAAVSVAWTKSVWLAFGMHFAWNYFEGPVFDFPVSGTLPKGSTMIHQVIHGPTWYTGGAFGPEAGVTELIAIAVAFTILYALFKRGMFKNVPDPREPYAMASPP